MSFSFEVVDTMCMRAAIALAFIAATACADEPVSAERAIEAFRSREFNEREAGRLRLIEIGRDAVEPLVQALSDDDPEVADRALSVLRQFARGPREELRSAAEERLLASAEIVSPAVHTAWSEAVATIRSRRKQAAILMLERLGAEFSSRARLIGPGGIVEAGESIEFGPTWRGTVSDLKHLADLGDLKRIVFNRVAFGEEESRALERVSSLRALSIKRTTLTAAAIKHVAAYRLLDDLEILYVPIDAAGLEHLHSCGHLTSIRLFGNDITAEQSTAVIAALPQTKVDIRRGGFLGVGVQPHPAGAEISNIQPNSAALAANLEIGDILVSLNADRVNDFESLTAAIGKHHVGDEIEVTYLRDGERRSVKTKLGEWE